MVSYYASFICNLEIFAKIEKVFLAAIFLFNSFTEEIIENIRLLKAILYLFGTFIFLNNDKT